MDNANENQRAPGAGAPPELGLTPPPPRSLFADDGPTPLPPDGSRLPPLTVAKPRLNVFTRLVLPVAILIIGIACIAWVAQNLPSRGRTPQAAKPGDAIQFEPATFVWDPKDPKYIPDFELGSAGYYDYQFVNSSANEVELGVTQTSCTCSGVSVAVFQTPGDRAEYRNDKASRKLSWTKLEIDKDLRSKVTVPAQAGGVLRIAWNGAKTEPEHMRLMTKIWSRAGHGEDPRVKDLVVLVNYVRPAKFFPDKEQIDLGTISPKEQRTESFLCWSATRDLDVQAAGDDKLIKVVARKLDAKECANLQKEMREHKEITRVRSAHKVTVTLLEENGGQQLDMGLFLKPVPLAITSNGQPIDVPLPMLRATVLGDVSLGPEEEGGRIDFNIFSAKSGKTKKVTVFSPKEAKLSFVGCDPVLLDLEVELKKVKTVGPKTQWQMDVTAKPNRDPGLLPESGVIVLRCELPATQTTPATTRLVRIHVIGTAESRH